MSRDYYHEQVQKIHDQRLKARASWLKIVVQGFAFEMFFSMVIVAHLIFMVVDTDRSFGTQGPGSTGLEIEVCFLALYIVELVLKLSVDGWHFFYGPGWKSNLFDLFLVVTGSVDVIGLFAKDGELFNSMVLKALRVFRLQKVFRIHRVIGMANDTQMVLRGLAACVGVLVGASFLVFVYFLVFGIFFSQAVSSHIADSGGEVRGEVLEFYITNFGTVFRSMFTLYQCVSGGRVWTYTWAALGPVWPGEALSSLFVVFHFVYLVLMVNVVSSVYVQKVLLYSLDQTAGVKLQMERKDREDARTILEDCDRNFGEGDTLNYKELLRLLLVPEVLELFDVRGIKLEDARALHRTIAEKPAGPETPQPWELNVKRKEFFRLCMRLNRDISTADFARSNCAVRHFESDQFEHNRHVDASMDQLGKRLDQVNHVLRTLRQVLAPTTK